MSAQINPVNRRTAMPVVAGVFDIVVGSFCVLGALIFALIALFAVPAIGIAVGGIPFFAGFAVLVIALLVAVLGALAVVGGIYSLRRRMWGWALVGSIAATFISNILGIVSIVLTAASKNEFAQ